MQTRFEHIEALKLHGVVQSFEARSSTCQLAELDAELLASTRAAVGLVDWADADYLIRRRMADWCGSTLVMRQAAELLFRRALPDHPNAGVRIFRVVGTERRMGLEHNVEELPRVEGALPGVLREVFGIIEGMLRRPSRLGPGGRFRQTTEYPEFSWQEAILNAVAHRDYGVQGRCVEVWLYDDRMEVVSPGGLPPAIDLQRLRALEPCHESRNPRIVRGLVDLGLMRDQGEGVPRMFAEMATSFLPQPELLADAHGVRVILRNTMTLSTADRDFIGQLAHEDLTEQAFRGLLEARRYGRIDNARMRSVAGLDTLAASLILRHLRDFGLLALHGAGSASYYTLGPRLLSASDELSGESTELSGESIKLSGESTELSGESTELSGESIKLSPRHAVPAALREQITKLGKKPKGSELRGVILLLCDAAPRDVATLANILQRNPIALRRHIRLMVLAGSLRLRFPDRPTHPQQAYVAAQGDLLAASTD